MDAAFWLMIAALGTAVLAFAPVMMWLATRHKENEARFQNEMARRIAEAGDAGPLLEYVRGLERAEAARTRLKARMAGLITLAVGIALMIMLHQFAVGSPAYLVGLIPLLVGVALLLSSEFMMKPGNPAA